MDLAAIYQAIVLQGNDVRSLRTEIRSEISRLEGKIDTLSAKVGNYHMSVMGHGILITELDERTTRLEQRQGSSGAA